MSNINAAYANINANNLRTLQQQLSFEKESKLKKHEKLAKYENENSSNSKELAFALNQIATTERQSLLLSLSYELSEVPSSLLYNHVTLKLKLTRLCLQVFKIKNLMCDSLMLYSEINPKLFSKL